MKKFISGQTAPQSGTYNEVASNGRVINTVNMEEGDTFPPTQSSENHFKMR